MAASVTTEGRRWGSRLSGTVRLIAHPQPVHGAGCTSGCRLSCAAAMEAWSRELEGGDVAVVLRNPGSMGSGELVDFDTTIIG